MSNNPLANETILTKIKKKSGNKPDETRQFKHIECELIGMNDAIRICATACACCWDKKVPESFDDIAEYVARRSRTGHTSVLEHSNIVLYLLISKSFEEEMIKLLDSIRYLETRTVMSEDGKYWHMIIGGSYVGYSNMYKEMDDLNNPILNAISGCLYTFAHSAGFEDICSMGLMDKSRFLNIEPDENFKLLNQLDAGDSDLYETELFKIIGMDSLKKLYTNLYRANKEAAKLISTYDLIKFATISVLFKNMSRTCTHELVRHRNAITQESQRYVDCSKAGFSSPELFKPDKYDKNHKYSIRFGSSPQMNLTLSEIGRAICDLYGMLQNPAITGAGYRLDKEDARAFLPGNVQCKKIYITFTYRNFFKFLNLRENKAAQAEIRLYATSVGEWFRNNTDFKTKEICDLYLNPRLLIEDPFNIDVDEGIVEEDITLTENDYFMAAGLDTESKE